MRQPLPPVAWDRSGRPLVLTLVPECLPLPRKPTYLKSPFDAARRCHYNRIPRPHPGQYHWQRIARGVFSGMIEQVKSDSDFDLPRQALAAMTMGEETGHANS